MFRKPGDGPCRPQSSTSEVIMHHLRKLLIYFLNIFTYERRQFVYQINFSNMQRKKQLKIIAIVK